MAGISILFWPAYGLLWKRKERRRCIILAYHHIAEDPCTSYDVSLDRFKYQMEYIHKHCQVITLDDWLEGSGRLSDRKRNVVLTFDDGYESFERHVVPVLIKYGFHAHLFIPVDFVKNRGEESGSLKRMCSKHQANRKVMSWEQIGNIDETVVTVGSHTMTHPRLGLIPVQDLEKEIGGSKIILEEKLKRVVRYFAYPYSLRGGRVDSKRESVIRRLFIQYHYQAACTTDMGFNRHRTCPYHLRRIQIFKDDGNFMFKSKIRGALNWLGKLQKILRRFDLLKNHEKGGRR